MKIMKNHSFKLIAAMFVAFIVTINVALCQSPPPLPAMPLDLWVLAQTNWLDLFGDEPLGFAGLNVASGWGDRAETALSVDTNCPAYLNLPATNAYGGNNISLDTGAITFWYQANYTSVPDGGTGPTNWASLFTAGTVYDKAHQPHAGRSPLIRTVQI